MNTTELDAIIEAKMRLAGVGRPTIRAFLNAVRRVVAGERGMLPEASLEPVASLPKLEEFPESDMGSSGVLNQLAVVKLNGGLGTGMGLDKAESLISVNGQDTFLDFIARQIFHLRGGNRRSEPAFYLMDSFATQQDTLNYLRKDHGLSWKPFWPGAFGSLRGRHRFWELVMRELEQELPVMTAVG